MDEELNLDDINKKMKQYEDFDTSPDTNIGNIIYVLHAVKGVGKTVNSIALGLNLIDELPTKCNKIGIISFDRKATINHQKLFNNDPKIVVYDGLRYLDKTPDRVLDTSDNTYHYLEKLFKEEIYKQNYDCILIDGLEILSLIFEMKMRHDEGFTPVQGIKNRNVWKLRRFLLQQLHNWANHAANKIVVYTVYSEMAEIVEAGEIVGKVAVPKYTGVILYESDIILQCSKLGHGEKQSYWLTVDTSKFPDIAKEGAKINVTNIFEKLDNTKPAINSTQKDLKSQISQDIKPMSEIEIIEEDNKEQEDIGILGLGDI